MNLGSVKQPVTALLPRMTSLTQVRSLKPVRMLPKEIKEFMQLFALSGWEYVRLPLYIH